ncbi:MAG: hypothetical protein SGBAC_011353, partial [Bacillariaceae sp.]
MTNTANSKKEFCSPIMCCSDDNEPQKRDECMCGFGYLNGGLPVSAAQCFLILGSFFSIASLGDCAFVKIDEDLRFVLGPTKISNTFGYLTFEDIVDGRCYWYDDGGATSSAQLQEYWDFLGHDFNLTRIFAMIGAAGGVLQFLYSITFCCTSQVRRMRYLQFFLVSIVLTCFQGLTLLIFNSEFCEEYTCTFGRSAGFSGAACACYFFAGSMYLSMSDYPGDEFAGRSNGTTGAHSEQEDFNDEESAASSDAGDGATDASYPDSMSEGDDDQDKTPPTSNIKNVGGDVEAPNLLEAPLATIADNESAASGDSLSAPSVTSIYIEDGASATPSNDGSALGPPPTTEEDKDPLATAFSDPSATAQPATTAAEPAAVTGTEEEVVEEEVIEEEFFDENGATIEEEVVFEHEDGEDMEEIIEEYVEGDETIEEEIIEEEVNGGLPTVVEEDGEPTESEAAPEAPLSP